MSGTFSQTATSGGSLLVISIWVLTMFSILGVGVSRITSSQLRLARRIEGRAVSVGLAQAALLHARALRKENTDSYDSRYALRTVQRRQLGLGEFSYTLVDEESRINVNKTPQQILARVPGMTLDGAIAMTTSTWKPFPVLEELRLLDEQITEEAYQQAKPWLTVFGSGRVNINTAPPEVLKALGLDEGLVDTITTFRAGKDGQEGTADDGIFENAGTIISTLRSSTSLFAAQEAALLQLVSQGLLDVRSTTFAIQVKTAVLGRPVMTYTIVFDAAADKVRQWSEL